MKLCYISYNEIQTQNFAKKLAKDFLPGDIILLYGDLGAGKTCFVKGVAKGLGINSDRVNSPTFIILNEYHEGKIPLYHFDFYRIENFNEVENIGFFDYLNSDGISIIEWPQIVENHIDNKLCKVSINVINDKKREIKIIK